MGNNIYYNLAKSIMKRGEDAESIALELAEASKQFRRLTNRVRLGK